ncbi:MAG: preprotein translocase subunit Sec61beta [Candidatus Woesearchaeota archaeon]
MPSSTAGITRYFDDYKSKIELSPGHVIILCIVVMIILAALHTFGQGILG